MARHLPDPTISASADLEERLAFMRRDYLASKSKAAEGDRSAAWNVFIEDFERLFAQSDAWRHFRANGFSFGLDDCLLATTGGGRTPHYYANHDPVLRPWPFDRPKLEAWTKNTARRALELMSMDDLAFFAEGKIGNPPSVPILGQDIVCNYHDLVLCLYAKRLRDLAPDGWRPSSILEIGGGYGGLSAKLKRLWPDARVIVVDLPEVLALQTYYLSEALPEARIGGETAMDQDGWETPADMLALTPDRLSMIPDGAVDLVINTRSFMEMSTEIIARYFAEIQRVTRPDGGLFYNVNRYAKQNPAGGVIRFREYPYDANWTVLLSEVSPIQSQMHELLAGRLSPAAGNTEQANIRQALAALGDGPDIAAKGTYGARPTPTA